MVRRFAPGELTRPQAVRFLQRATFGGSTADVNHLIAVGSDSWFAEQLSTPAGRSHLDARAADIGLDSSIWGRYLSSPAQLRARLSYALSQILVVSDVEVSENRVARFADLLEAGCFGTYRELLEVVTRSTAMGSYLTYNGNRREDRSRGRTPDENFAREVMQLFSIGLWKLNTDGSRRTDSAGDPIPTYDQNDILGLARVFTGFQSTTDLADIQRYALPMTSDGDFSRRYHEQNEKRFLGIVIPANGSITLDQSLAIALDTLAGHANTAPFISRQLIQRLVTSNPSRGYVGRVAAVFNNDGAGIRGNLGAVAQAILQDDEAWSTAPDQTFGKIREPVLRYTTIVRALGVSSNSPAWAVRSIGDQATELGQQPYESPSVFNFYRPGYVPPHTAIAAAGLVSPEMQIANESAAIGWVNFVARTLKYPPARTKDGFRQEMAYDLDALLAVVSMKDLTAEAAGSVVAELSSRLCPDGLNAGLKSIIVRRVREIRDDRYDPARTDSSMVNLRSKVHLERVIAAVMLIAVSTDFLHEGRPR